MDCPQCSLLMQVVKTESHYGTPMYLDQCQKCGGIWFDGQELWGVKQGKAQEIDVEKLVQSAPFQKETLACPRDGKRLERFKDQNFPASIDVERCSTCGGFWLNRGEFRQFQENISPKREAAEPEKDAQVAARVQAILREHKGGGYNTLGNLSSFLTAPANAPFGGSSSSGTPGADKGAMATEIIFDLVNILLQLFLHR